jgi:biopolymer transport protein ExbB/TolQ|tara:strand:+ start:3547 stop:3948 length:402 start_codon:yes stop_codon:yes gene_type:complete
MKIGLIMGVLLLATIAGSAYWIDRLQDDIGTLKGNQIILETKIQEQNEAIENYLNKQQQTQNQLIALEKEKQEAMRDVNKLRKTFASHDLDELTLAKPELMEGKINRASKRVLETLEKLTDPNQFNEKDSNNS